MVAEIDVGLLYADEQAFFLRRFGRPFVERVELLV
jgi:hypothetical protein